MHLGTAINSSDCEVKGHKRPNTVKLSSLWVIVSLCLNCAVDGSAILGEIRSKGERSRPRPAAEICNAGFHQSDWYWTIFVALHECMSGGHYVEKTHLLVCLRWHKQLHGAENRTRCGDVCEYELKSTLLARRFVNSVVSLLWSDGLANIQCRASRRRSKWCLLERDSRCSITWLTLTLLYA